MNHELLSILVIFCATLLLALPWAATWPPSTAATRAGATSWPRWNA
ncbi:hypothetical protein [Hymenobacter cellulosilyticus]|nr:hypothetical protein [Hymenobacter cellulosilyticus]